MRSTAYTSEDNVVLISITGQDQPSVVPSITTIMAGYTLEILDVTHSVIHHTLHWCMLVRLDDRTFLNAMEHCCRQ